jgi:hypothetical protein
LDLVRGGGPSDGLGTATAQQFVFVKNDSFNSSKAALHIEIFAKRACVALHAMMFLAITFPACVGVDVGW